MLFSSICVLYNSRLSQYSSLKQIAILVLNFVKEYTGFELPILSESDKFNSDDQSLPQVPQVSSQGSNVIDKEQGMSEGDASLEGHKDQALTVKDTISRSEYQTNVEYQTKSVSSSENQTNISTSGDSVKSSENKRNMSTSGDSVASTDNQSFTNVEYQTNSVSLSENKTKVSTLGDSASSTDNIKTTENFRVPFIIKVVVITVSVIGGVTLIHNYGPNLVHDIIDSTPIVNSVVHSTNSWWGSFISWFQSPPLPIAPPFERNNEDIINTIVDREDILSEYDHFFKELSLSIPVSQILNFSSQAQAQVQDSVKDKSPRPKIVKSNFGFVFLVYKLDKDLLTKELLTYYIKTSWKIIFPGKLASKYAAVYITLNYGDGVFKSLGKASKVNVSDLDRYIRFLTGQLDFKDNRYKNNKMDSIYFGFKILSTRNLNNYKSVIHDTLHNPRSKKDLNNKQLTTESMNEIFGHNLPNNCNLFSWGKIINHEGDRLVIESTVNDTTYYYIVELSPSCNHIRISDKVEGGLNLLNFTDYPKDSTMVNFTRVVKNIEYIYKNGVPITTMETKNFSTIVPLTESKSMQNKILTFDIETRTIEGVMIPYCICYHDGKGTGTFWLTKFVSPEAMVEAFIKMLLSESHYNNYIVYAHNFSKFDGVFILKHLIKICKELKLKTDIIKKDSDLINIRITGPRFNITFRDSFLLLPASLKDLSKSFGLPVYQQKGIFPHAFVSDPNVSLDYIGAVPDFKYFSGITLELYNEYCSHFNKKTKWNLAREAKIYCQLDCISLYQNLIKFSDNIFKDLNVSLKHTPTTSSLALRAFRTKFLNTNTNIPVITDEVFDFIKKSYTGGPVDVFIPHGFNVYHYDVNSLYPFVMQKYPMPVGDLTYFVGNIDMDINDLYEKTQTKSTNNRPNGFFEVEVETPEQLHIPVLQFKQG